VEAPNNSGLELGAALGELAEAGRDKVTFVTSPTLNSFPAWQEQLIAESTGKDDTGIVPVADEPLSDPDSYGDDRVFVYFYLHGEQDRDMIGKLDALDEAGHPVISVRLNDRYDLAREMYRWEMGVAAAGAVLGIHPFNQPNVEAAKNLARQMVDEYREKGKLPEGETAPLTADSLHAFLAQAESGDYIALQAFVQPTDETTEALQSLRAELRDQYKLATTVGYGPRFLHSTGQLHKGDGGNGLFIQFTSEAEVDVPIPNEAGSAESDISFGVLKMAQALGDAQALRDEDRRLIRFHLDREVVAGLQRLAEAATK
jgi:transaldolase/glucose-6-phosphate isomerase